MKKIFLATPLIIATPIVAVVSCGGNKTPEDKTSNKPTVIKNTKNKQINNLKDGTYKIGFWNVLNNGKTQGYKNDAIAKVIKHSKMTMVGLAEIDKTIAVDTIADYLSQYTNNPWKAVYTKDKSGASTANSATKEHYGFVYRSDLYQAVNFDNTQTPGAVYDNPIINGMEYERPPFGVKFKTSNKEFTAVIEHADGPGVGKGETRDQHGNGHQEVWEANNLDKVMDWFDKHDGSNKNLIFMGDTNIKTSYNNEPFNNLLNNGYKAILPTGRGNETSLKRSSNSGYSETYDKIFTNMSASNGTKYPLYNVFKDGILDEQAFIQRVKNEKGPYKQKDGYVYYGISDHCPVWADYNLK